MTACATRHSTSTPATNAVTSSAPLDERISARGSTAAATGPLGCTSTSGCVSSKSSTWEAMPSISAASNMSVRSARPSSTACAGPANGERLASAMSTDSWLAPPIVQPVQLTMARIASCTTAGGRSSKREWATYRANCRVSPMACSVDTGARFLDQLAPVFLFRGDQSGELRRSPAHGLHPAFVQEPVPDVG